MGTLERIRIGRWTATPALNLLEHGSHSIKIEPRAMDVLVTLAQRQGAVVSVDELIESVWKGVVVGEGSVYLAIRQLRQALDDRDGPSYIETIPKRGYRLIAAAEPIGPEASSTPTTTHRWQVKRVWFAIGVASAVLFVGAIVGLRNAAHHKESSVAVLPFENRSSDPEQEYFADGVTEEILNTLAGVRDLRVIGRTSSFRFKDRKEGLGAIAKTLDVEHILEGSVRKSGAHVRVSAQLSNARTGEQLWSESYERKLDDIFLIQEAIARSVAQALQIKLRVGDLSRVPGMTRNVEAYDEHLRAYALNLEGDYDRAIAHLQRAVALDPEFSVAWSGMGAVYFNGALRLPPHRAEEWERMGSEALTRARALTPDAPHVLLQDAIREARRCNWVGAAPLYDALQPAYEKYGAANQAAGPRGIFLSYVGRVREAIPHIERARAEDPLAPGIAGFLGRAYLSRGDTAAAFAEIDRGLELQGARRWLQYLAFWIALNTNDRLEIERRLQSVRESTESSGQADRLFELIQLLDSPAAAEAEIRRIAALDDPNERVHLAIWAAHVHAPELALELMAKEAHNGEAIPALWMPVMRDVRKLPAFKELVRASGLVDYWRAYGWSDFCRPVGDEDFQCS